jgi:hypothetical protein
MIDGWRTATDMTLQDALDKFVELGVKDSYNLNYPRRFASGPDLETLRMQ